MFDLLLAHFGPQHWWPGETPFEVCVGAILTQNTAWGNVEKAITNLKKAGLLDFVTLCAASDATIASLIKPAGYFNIKTKRLRSFLNFVKDEGGNFDELAKIPGDKLRNKLLAVTGIGPETADSMVLYAFGKPTFVVDAYTKRILMRHSLMGEETDYQQIKNYFESHLAMDQKLFNEFHALIVMTGKDFCRKSKPKCDECPLREFNGGPSLAAL